MIRRHLLLLSVVVLTGCFLPKTARFSSHKTAPPADRTYVFTSTAPNDDDLLVGVSDPYTVCIGKGACSVPTRCGVDVTSWESIDLYNAATTRWYITAVQRAVAYCPANPKRNQVLDELRMHLGDLYWQLDAEDRAIS